jgi:hypothetical protein
VEREATDLGDVMTVTWLPRFAENAYADFFPEITPGNMEEWQPVLETRVKTLSDGSMQVKLDVVEGSRLFFRLRAARP